HRGNARVLVLCGPVSNRRATERRHAPGRHGAGWRDSVDAGEAVRDVLRALCGFGVPWHRNHSVRAVVSPDPPQVSPRGAAPSRASHVERTAMSPETTYSINTDVKFTPLELIDVKGLAAACRQQWFNQTLCRVNDSVVRLGVLQGEFHWHKHEKEDEFF